MKNELFNEKLTTDFADYYGLTQIFLGKKWHKMHKRQQKMTKTRAFLVNLPYTGHQPFYI
jgi:hypothetical protein